MSVAKSYAQALYQAAVENKKDGLSAEVLEKQLADFSSVVENSPELRQALFSPVANTREKTAILEQLSAKLNLNPLLLSFLCLLAKKSRLPFLSEVAEAFTTARIAAEGRIAGVLEAADAMSEQDVQGLAKAFSQKLGKPVTFKVSTQPWLLAGMRVTVHGITSDGSLHSQLQRLRERLAEGAAALENVAR
jgi:F-type H+-transporting ATPase subunit delta